jgi:hypothetical protein
VSSVGPFRYVPALAAFGGVAVWLALCWHGPITNDLMWQLWIGQRLHAGATLYVDILEINPPLWFWVAAGSEGLVGPARLSSFHALLLIFAAVTLAAALFGLRLARGLTERWAFVAALLLFLFLTSYYSLGQREQFAFLVSSPLLLLAARRAEGLKVAPSLAFAAGMLAAPGLLLKPYFLLAPLMLEAWLSFRAKAIAVKPENVALGRPGCFMRFQSCCSRPLTSALWCPWSAPPTMATILRYWAWCSARM